MILSAGNDWPWITKVRVTTKVFGSVWHPFASAIRVYVNGVGVRKSDKLVIVCRAECAHQAILTTSFSPVMRHSPYTRGMRAKRSAHEIAYADIIRSDVSCGSSGKHRCSKKRRRLEGPCHGVEPNFNFQKPYLTARRSSMKWHEVRLCGFRPMRSTHKNLFVWEGFSSPKDPETLKSTALAPDSPSAGTKGAITDKNIPANDNGNSGNALRSLLETHS
jgi:hypothetical protein